jgi:hypothetical protein
VLFYAKDLERYRRELAHLKVWEQNVPVPFAERYRLQAKIAIALLAQLAEQVTLNH